MLAMNYIKSDNGLSVTQPAGDMSSNSYTPRVMSAMKYVQSEKGLPVTQPEEFRRDSKEASVYLKQMT